MDVNVDEKEIAIDVLNGLPPWYQKLIVALDSMAHE